MPVEYHRFKIWAYPQSSNIDSLASCLWAWRAFDDQQMIAKSPFFYRSKEQAIRWAKIHLARVP